MIPPGESRPLYSDLWDETAHELVEAKGTVNRDNLRQAVGQLLDYGRFAEAKTHAVLSPRGLGPTCWPTSPPLVSLSSTRPVIPGRDSTP